MNTQVKVALAIATAFVVAMGGLLVWSGRDDPAPAVEPDGAAASASDRAMRDDTRILGTRGTSKVTLVEFLDFECEACRAMFPVVEEMRAKYGAQVTFAARYFPIPSHFNAERAARAVESAARQGKFVEMYTKMYETQSEWGEQQVPMDGTFREFAQELGLDMSVFDSDYRSDAVAQRVRSDYEDGVALGVNGTPTLFLNGEKFQPSSAAEFDQALQDALKE